MDKIKIRGGKQLNGKIYIGGAKNAALPLITASLLTEDEVVLSNVPALQVQRPRKEKRYSELLHRLR